MAAKSLQGEMLEYFTRLSIAEQKSVLQLVKTFAVGDADDFEPLTLEEYNRELDEADAEIEAGNYITHEEVMKKYLH
jgi:hypothetical protein